MEASRLFNNSVIVRMRELSDHEVMNMVFPFIGAVSDLICRLDCGLGTEVFTCYVDVIILL